MKVITGIFLKGLALVLPIGVTAYLLYWMGYGAERGLRKLVERIPVVEYFPGLGILLAVALIFGIGLLAEAYFIRRIGQFFEKLVLKIPIVKTIYGGLRDMMGYFSKAREGGGPSRVVTLSLPDGSTMLGFQTVDHLRDVGLSDDGEDRVAVYLPMSYQIGGFTVFARRADVTPVREMDAETAMSFILTAGMAGRKQKETPAL